MLAALGGLFWKGGRDPQPPSGHIPAELAEAIGAAMVLRRSDPDPETGEIRELVKVAGLGAWYWSGVRPAADLIARRWPDLPAATCRRAARLLASVLASRHYGAAARPRRQGGWVWDWDR